MQITEGQRIHGDIPCAALKKNNVMSEKFLTKDRAQASILRGNVCDSTTSNIYLKCAYFVRCGKVLQSILMWGRREIIEEKTKRKNILMYVCYKTPKHHVYPYKRETCYYS